MTEKSEFKGDDYFERLYSSKRRIKRRVLRMERVTARHLSFLTATSKSLKNQRLESDLEWLLTWKLKTGCFPEFMWCDEVEIQEIFLTRKNFIKIKALIWVGPESTDELYQVLMEGEMELKSTGKQFKNYYFSIQYQGSVFLASKNLTSCISNAPAGLDSQTCCSAAAVQGVR